MYKLALIRTSSSFLDFDSYNVQELGLAKELIRFGYVVDIYSVNSKYKDEIIKITENITIYKQKCIKLPGQNGFFPSLIDKLTKKNYDLIQVGEDSQLSSVIISCYAKKKKIPLILWQGMYENYKSNFKNNVQKIYDTFLLPRLRKNYSMAICKTNAAEQYLIKKGFTKTSIAGVGFDTTRLSTISVSRDLKSELKLPINKKVVLYVGKLEDRRNPHFLLNLFENRELNDSAVLLIIGSGPLKEEVCNRVQSPSLKNKVFYVPYVSQDEISDYYSISDLFLLPTNYEIYGMVIMEALYFGLPVITTSTAGSEYLISHEKNGYIIDDLDVDKWTERIQDIIFSNEKLEMLSKDAKIRSRALEWNRIVENYDLIYKKCLSLLY